MFAGVLCMKIVYALGAGLCSNAIYEYKREIPNKEKREQQKEKKKGEGMHPPHHKQK